jgi:cobalt/nickel transport system permease protein
MLAVSVALIVQAFFFGDGGVTAIGANCFNMAIAGSLVAYAVYRLIAGGSAIASFRRVAAAGIAGYAAINVSALLAAIEFGVQPLWFRDASGAPLYCPYPLSVSIPAMMIGHLTFAGMAEMIVSAGLVAFLQRSDPSLLKTTAGAVTAKEIDRVGVRRLQPLWMGLGLLLMLTPLGILAAGTAWGEWAASDFASPGIRQQISGASLHQAPPAEAPSGLARMSQMWTAPFGGYAPPYIRSAKFGYFLSAMFGAGLVILACYLLGRLMREAALGGSEEPAS